MSTIPISPSIVDVIPGVLNAGGNGEILNGLMGTQTFAKIPYGEVESFVSANAVGDLFGFTSPEYLKAVIYFNGFNSPPPTQLPGQLLAFHYPQGPVKAWMSSGPFDTYTVAQIQAMTGTLDITIDGYAFNAAALNLSAATSYSSAAGIIQTALNGSLASACVLPTSSIAPGTSITLTATISNNIMNVTNVSAGIVEPGAILTGGSIVSGTQVTAQLTSTALAGALGGTGTYSVSHAQVLVSTSLTGTYGVLTASAPSSGTVSAGQTLTGSGVTAGTMVWGQLTGTLGEAGTYVVSPSQTVAGPETITGDPTVCSVTFDSTTGSLIIESGTVGTGSSIAFATGSLATTLFFTSATGATLSQGAAAAVPAALMNVITGVNTNWATLFFATDPDDGGGNSIKLSWAAWVNSQPNDTYTYAASDPDITPTLSNSATTSLGYLVNVVNNYSGTQCIYDPTNGGYDAFSAGYAATLNFNQQNGRATLAFRGQTGVPAAVSNAQAAANLKANGYNYMGAYATANQQFIFWYSGSISGPFTWTDSYVNQIALNSALTLAMIELLVAEGTIPYNTFGYDLIHAAALDPINGALNFGTIRAGVPLSSAQAANVNGQAGFPISQILSTVGWYLYIQPATAQVRAARQSPVIILWYTDGESVQQITISSIDIL